MMTEERRDRWAEWILEKRYGADLKNTKERESVLEFLVPVRDRVLENAQLGSGNTLLDVGTGDGLIAFGALDRVGNDGKVIMSDISKDLLDHTQSLAQDLGVGDRCQFVCASADDLSPCEDNSVDAVTTRSVMIYVNDKQKAFDEFFRVLKPNGRISIFEPINRYHRSEHGTIFDGMDIEPVHEIAVKVSHVFEKLQPWNSDPMLNFTEKDLFDQALQSGFSPLYLSLELKYQRKWIPMDWETWSNRSFNPNVPSIREVIEDTLTQAERDAFTNHMMPVVESGEWHRKMAFAYLWGTKPEE